MNTNLPRIYGNDLNKVVLHHDIATSHTSYKTTNFSVEIGRTYGIKIMANSEIPVKSPDISPMDFFGFGYLNHRLIRRRATTWNGVWKVLNQDWRKVTPE